ncbi:hypothetical protein PHYPSEUDO_014499 [Phytophthora pseudosyringae]|uniref:Uncharacterized protein n=1 Tax=Phytophthora pseudosyringae TaxID=221518 RepID=A0A8T1V936_9STRA|nr:hypothetical protein PHYPSEUDO_014499 [Phytophthora pseudosyringae]
MTHSEKHPAPSAEPRDPKRRRTSSRSKNAAKPPISRQDRVLFKEIWRALQRDGWTSKAPRDLDNSYRYAKPSCNPDGEDGIDYFRGEQALWTATKSRATDSLARSDEAQGSQNAVTDDVISVEDSEGDTTLGPLSHSGVGGGTGAARDAATALRTGREGQGRGGGTDRPTGRGRSRGDVKYRRGRGGQNVVSDQGQGRQDGATDDIIVIEGGDDDKEGAAVDLVSSGGVDDGADVAPSGESASRSTGRVQGRGGGTDGSTGRGRASGDV